MQFKRRWGFEEMHVPIGLVRVLNVALAYCLKATGLPVEEEDSRTFVLSLCLGSSARIGLYSQLH